MRKNFDQELASLKGGLVQINNVLKTPTTNRRKHERAILNREIQIARIDFFIRGYNLCKKELKPQEKLNV